MGRHLAVGVLVAATSLWIGCAPSHRMVHQSNTFFERCHGADYDPQIAHADRRECWSRWLAHYTLGQPPERIEYAETRVRTLDSGEQPTPLPGLPQSAVGTAYTSQFLSTAGDEAPEAGTEGQAPTTAGAPAPREDLPEPPDTDGAACADVCAPRWYSCIVECAEPRGACRRACETEHRTCIAGCY